MKGGARRDPGAMHAMRSASDGTVSIAPSAEFRGLRSHPRSSRVIAINSGRIRASRRPVKSHARPPFAERSKRDLFFGIVIARSPASGRECHSPGGQRGQIGTDDGPRTKDAVEKGSGTARVAMFVPMFRARYMDRGLLLNIMI